MIKRATPEDFEKLKEIKIASKAEELKYSKSLKSIEETQSYFREYLKIDLNHDQRALFYYEENNKILGIILAKFFKPLRISKYKLKGHISNLFVVPEARNKGIGKKLILKAESFLKDKGVSYHSLEIHVDNGEALDLYHKQGYKDYTIKLVKGL